MENGWLFRTISGEIPRDRYLLLGSASQWRRIPSCRADPGNPRMYTEFFGLRELPFNNTPDPRFFYSTPDHEEALASLIYAVKERKGFVLLTGEVGAGKTLVSRLMIKHFGGTIAFANINHAIKDSGDLVESLCAEFELPHERQASNAYLVRTLHDFLLAKFAQNTPVVLVLDEAQTLPVEAFEQLRMIGNLEADDAKLLQIAIVGQPELQTMFQSNALRQLRQRLFRSFHLPALNRNATEGYIRHRLQVAGGSEPALFGPRCIDAIHKASRGLPRLINTLCDNILLSAYSADRRHFDTPFVENVIANLAPADPPPSTSAVWQTASTARMAPRFVAAASPDHERLEEAAEQASRLVKQIESHVRLGAAMAEKLDTSTRTAAESQQQLLQRQRQLQLLLSHVQTAATQLAPLLGQIQAGTRKSVECSQRAETVLRRLADQTSSSQTLLERVDDSLHRLRLAETEKRFVPQPDPITAEAPNPAVASIGPHVQPIQRKAPQPIAERKRDRSEVPFMEQDEFSAKSVRPALRLVEHMESLADLVHQAVRACTVH